MILKQIQKLIKVVDIYHLPFILKTPWKQKQILVNIFLDSKNLKFKLIY